MFDFTTVSTWFHSLLTGVMPEWLAIGIECLIVLLFIIILYAMLAIILIYAERKICAFFQCRIGPNRVGKWGVLQVFADVLKMLTKEIIKMRQSDRLLHDMAPYFVLVASFLTFSCIPWNKGLEILDFNLAGWASHSKYPMIGAMRSGAQLISYELSIGMTMLVVILLNGSMQLSEIVQQQADYGWNIVRGHVPAVLAFLIYLVAGNAECNRGPFDLPEAESELTAGYHTEYSGMHFGFFYLAEYLNLFICGAMAATIFLGGWAPFYIQGADGFNSVMAAIPGFVWFFAKAFFVVFLLMWIRWTFPRLRIDQLLTLEWKYLMPLSMINIVLMALVVCFGLTIN